MREIKFRAWDKEQNKMLTFNDGMDGEYRYHLCWWQSSKVPYPALYKNSCCAKQDDYKIMQYTGLKDKNGKEIYEGDIVRNGSTHGNDPKQFTVVWNERDGAFNGRVGVSRLPMSCAYWFYGDCEVIGNIYENPELLK